MRIFNRSFPHPFNFLKTYFECKTFGTWTIMYVHPILSDYVRIHNLEFEDGQPQELKYDDMSGLI